MLEFRTPGYKGFSTKFSPFYDSRLAVATGQNFGIVGNGRLHILGLTDNGIVEEQFFATRDTVYDTAWSEENENHIWAACGDGTVKLFDITHPQFPVKEWAEHGREVFCVNYNPITKTVALSSSWDGTVKIIYPRHDVSILSIPTHTCTYSAQFSPHHDGLVAAIGFDNALRAFDIRERPGSDKFNAFFHHITPPDQFVPNVPRHEQPHTEGLTLDFNKYRPSVLAVGSTDRLIRIFDLRNLAQGPVSVLPGHDFAVRKVAWSPHLSDVLISCSYDMTVRVWSDASLTERGSPHSPAANGEPYPGGRQLGVMERHTEFVIGADWCLFGLEGWCATTAWDERVLVWDVRATMGP